MTMPDPATCDWRDAYCQDEPDLWLHSWRCGGCGRTLRLCPFHYGYHVQFTVLGPPCPTCGTQLLATAIPVDMPALSFIREIAHA